MHLIKKKLQDLQMKKEKKKKLTYQKKKQSIELDPEMARMLKLPGKNLNNGSELLKIYHTNVRCQ